MSGIIGGAGSKSGVIGSTLKPNQPRFKAWYAADGFTNHASTDFPWDETEINVGNCFNTTTHRFTAPVAGDYWLDFYSIFQGTAVNGWAGFNFSIGTHKGSTTHFNEEFSNASAWKQVLLSGIYTLAHGCTVGVRTSTITSFHGNDYASFSGWLVG